MNEEKFTGRADIYSIYRPAYPKLFLDYLYSKIGFSASSVIADIGAGTGIFSSMLLERGSFVFCVEPNADMRRTAQAKLKQYARCTLLDSPAESIELGPHTVDFVTVAQAFHWFDRNSFRAECRRILKPGGRVVLVWNIRDSTDALTLENAAINRRLCPKFKGFSGGSAEHPEAYDDFFKAGSRIFKEFENDLLFDKQGFIGRCLTGSYAPVESDPYYNDYVDSIGELFEKHCRQEQIRIANLTRCYIGEV